MPTPVKRNGRQVVWSQCSNCGAGASLADNRLRAKGDCDRDCMAYVLENSLVQAGSRPAGWRQWIIKHDTKGAA